MTPFEFLLIGHLIGDFLLQTSWMAQHKAKRWLPLLAHVSVYTTVVGVFGYASGGLSWFAVALIFGSHLALDRKTFVAFWVRRVQMVPHNAQPWLVIMADQIFHIIILALAILISQR
jgi:hypothetical protein